MNDKYNKHMLKVCSRAGKEDQYNIIRDKYFAEASALKIVLEKEKSDLAVIVAGIGKKYTGLLRDEMKIQVERMKELHNQIAERRRELTTLDREINERHMYYQRLTVEETKKIDVDFQAKVDAAYGEITARKYKELHEVFGYLE